MNYNINRKTFLKLISLGAITIITEPVLTSCDKEKIEKESITINDLSDYQLAIYQKGDSICIMYVRFNGYNYRKYYALELNNNTISEYLIYRKEKQNTYDNNLSFEDNFKKYYRIKSLEPTINIIQDVIGIKEEYTAEELKQALEVTEKELNQKEKVLTK